jgi:hypothetical protein
MPAVITGRDSTARYSAMRGPKAAWRSMAQDGPHREAIAILSPISTVPSHFISHISRIYRAYIATANSIEPLPAPLKDRFRIVKVPAPRLREHGEAGAVGLSRMPVARNRRVTMVPYGHDRE